jgi:hypothetical protein
MYGLVKYQSQENIHATLIIRNKSNRIPNMFKNINKNLNMEINHAYVWKVINKFYEHYKNVILSK